MGSWTGGRCPAPLPRPRPAFARRRGGRWGVTPETVTVLIAIVMVIGVIGALVPAVPDLVMMWVAGLVYGMVVGWGAWGPWLFGLMTLAALGGLLAEGGG